MWHVAIISKIHNERDNHDNDMEGLKKAAKDKM